MRNRSTESMVPEARFELAHPQRRRILNPLRLPFRHSGPGHALALPAQDVNQGRAIRRGQKETVRHDRSLACLRRYSLLAENVSQSAI